MNEKFENFLPHSGEFWFLYKRTSIRKNVISRMLNVPEYREAIQGFDGRIDDKVLYEIVKEAYIKMFRQNKTVRIARDVINAISKDVTGDAHTWVYESGFRIKETSRGFMIYDPSQSEAEAHV